MKQTYITLLLMSLFNTGFSQALSYDVRGVYSRPVKKEALHSAKLISDVIAGYPIHWITGYTWVEIAASRNGKEIKAVSINDTLNPAQKELLQTVDLGADIDITVKYYYKVPVTNVMEYNTMHTKMTIIPVTEAEYAAGHKQLLTYLKENAIDKISATASELFQQVVIKFTINEQGEIENPRVIQTFGKPEQDKILLDAIRNMPGWKPAEEGKGIKVKQEFEFVVGNRGGC